MDNSIFIFYIVIIMTIIYSLIMYIYKIPTTINKISNSYYKLLNYDGTLGLKFSNYDTINNQDIQVVSLNDSDNIIFGNSFLEKIGITSEFCKFGIKGNLFVILNYNDQVLISDNNKITGWATISQIPPIKCLVLVQLTTDSSGRLTDKVMLRLWNDTNAIISGSLTNTPKRITSNSFLNPSSLEINPDYLWTLKQYNALKID